MKTHRVVCASPSYIARRGRPQNPADLARHDCIRMNARGVHTHWPFVEKTGTTRQVVSGTVWVNNGDTLRQMALEGVGIARLGRFHVADDLREGRLIALLEKNNPNDIETIHAVYIGSGQVPTRVRAFIDHLVERLPTTLGRNPLV